MGEVQQHAPGCGALSGNWSAWTPFWSHAVGDPQSTRHWAVGELYEPLNLEPAFVLSVCRTCRNWMPRPKTCPTGECETGAQGEARSRVEQAEAWAHYEFVKGLARDFV